jgi:RND family efflux transporter MFP subunit
MQMPSRVHLYLLVLPVFVLALFTGCAERVQSAATQGPQALPVKVEAVKVERVPEFTEYLATLKSRRSSILQPEVEGQITRIFVHSGEFVEAGQPLLEIDPRRQAATLNSQEATRRSQMAQLEYNRAEYERNKALFAAGVVSRQALQQAESAYQASEANVESLAAAVRQQEVQLRYYEVKAPTDGTIGDIPVRVGDRVKVDTVLTTLDQSGALEAYISIPAELSGRARLGTPVELIGDDGKVALRTAVTFVSPRIDTATQLLLLKAVVPNQDRRYRNEQLVHAHVIWSEQERPVIPVTSVSRLGGQIFAFVAETSGNQTVARQRLIQTSGIQGNNYIVTGGIKPGERIIITGIQMLTDGMSITPQS